MESESNKLPSRTDHVFTWEQMARLDVPPVDAEGAHVRVTATVQGDEVSGYRIFIHVPEEWKRRQTQTTLADTARSIGLALLAAAFVIAVLAVFFRSLKQHDVAAVPWRQLGKLALVVLVASVATFITQAPQYLAGYRTDLPFRTFLGTTVIVLSLSGLVLYSAVIFLFGLALFFLARSYGSGRLRIRRPMPRAYYRDALFIGVCGTAVVFGVQRLPELPARLWPVARQRFGANVPFGLDALWPALHVMSETVTRAAIGVGIVALLLGFLSYYLPRMWMQLSALALLSLLATGHPGSTGDFIQSAAIMFIQLAILWWGVRRVAQLNLLGYLLVAVLAGLTEGAVTLLRQPNIQFREHGWIVIAACAILLFMDGHRVQRGCTARD